MTHSVLAVANEFLKAAEKHDEVLTPMHLQKLCFMAHGYTLALLHEPLIEDAPQAWDYGPVYPELYDAVKRYGSGAVTDLIRENNWASAEHVRGEVVSEAFSSDERDVIEEVFSAYAHFPAWQLSALTHEDGSPWALIYQRGRRSLTIPNELIETYFSDLTATAD